MAVPMKSSAKVLTLGSFRRRVASFHVTHAAVHDISTCFQMCHSSFSVAGRRNAFATFSEDELHVLWQAQHFGGLHCHLAWQTQHFRRVMLHDFCKLYCQDCEKWCQIFGMRGIF